MAGVIAALDGWMTKANGKGCKILSYFRRHVVARAPFAPRTLITQQPKPPQKMTTLRQFSAFDLLRFNSVNLDPLTEAYNMRFICNI